MREMVLNHISVQSPDRQAAVGWLRDISVGMSYLTTNKVAQLSLRMQHPEQEIHCLPDYSLSDAYQDLRQSGAREEYLFLMRLSTKCPLLREVELDVKDRFQACEAKQLPSEDGEPLVFCAITDCIAVGFPSEPVWDSDRLAISFNELLPDASIEERCESIDNLTRFVHARLIYERHRETFLQFESPSALWEHREERFPNLIFGPDVTIPPEFFLPIVKRLDELDKAAAEWRRVGGAIPRWPCKVTPESKELRKDKKLLDARRFRSQSSPRELFEWHARLGSGLRIHLRFDSSSQEIEIGYIGPHLPL